MQAAQAETDEAAFTVSDFNNGTDAASESQALGEQPTLPQLYDLLPLMKFKPAATSMPTPAPPTPPTPPTVAPSPPFRHVVVGAVSCQEKSVIGPWSICSKTCGPGVQERARHLTRIKNNHCLKMVFTQKRPCVAKPCA